MIERWQHHRWDIGDTSMRATGAWAIGVLLARGRGSGDPRCDLAGCCLTPAIRCCSTAGTERCIGHGTASRPLWCEEPTRPRLPSAGHVSAISARPRTRLWPALPAAREALTDDTVASRGPARVPPCPQADLYRLFPREVAGQRSYLLWNGLHDVAEPRGHRDDVDPAASHADAAVCRLGRCYSAPQRFGGQGTLCILGKVGYAAKPTP
jgi:hypothetical protein